MVTVAKGDYAIGLSSENKRPVLFKVESVVKGIVSGTIQKDPHLKEKRFTFEAPLKDIILSLGENPHPGKVYGFDCTSLYRGRKTHPEFGSLYWFYKPDDEVATKLMAAFDKAYKILKANRLEFIIQPNTCIWEIMPPNGERYAGMYKRSKNPEKNPNRLQIRPEIMPATEWVYVILHELAGHHLHFEFLTSKKLNAQWVKLFNTTIAISQVKKEKSIELLEGLLSQEDPPSAYKANLSEEDTEIYKMILRAISNQHSVSVKELDILFEADFRDEIKNVWPTRGVLRKDLDPLVSDYACKNFRELIAEAVAFKLTGKKLPKAVEALIEKSFSYARSNREKE